MSQLAMDFETSYHVGGKLFSHKADISKSKTINLPEPDPKTMARHADPNTSHQAALTVSKRAPSQQVQLLQTFDGGRELTDEESGDLSGLSKKPKCCYWKRLSELRQGGYIEDTGRTKASSVGEQQRVCRITCKGAAFLAAWKAVNV